MMIKLFYVFIWINALCLSSYPSPVSRTAYFFDGLYDRILDITGTKVKTFGFSDFSALEARASLNY